MEVTVQIYCGGYVKKPEVSFDLIKEKFLYAADRLPVTKVLMGWPSDKALYERTLELLAKKNIKLYLWFSVFSETGTVKNLSPLVDFSGNKIERDIIKEDEDFFFCCPNNADNIKKILEIYDENFSSIGFNGIFLDKIRYPSFANNPGKNGVFSCFCPECVKYYKSVNFDYKKAVSALSNHENTLNITEYKGNGKYFFKDEIIQEFFRIKAEIIFNSLKNICDHFNKQGLEIGFDVFAPFLAPFTGQDIIKLSSLCDFIKPMMYRVTNAPAGLPFETNALERHAGNNVIGKNLYSLGFCAEELNKLSISCGSSCDVYAGIEINRVKDLAEADTAYIEETINAFSKTKIKGYALSWNLLDMPQENIDKTAAMLKMQ